MALAMFTILTAWCLLYFMIALWFIAQKLTINFIRDLSALLDEVSVLFKVLASDQAILQI